MFAKATAKPKKTASGNTSNTRSIADEAIAALSDEGEDDSEMPDIKPDPEAGRARKDRQAELHRMMDDESDEEAASKSETPAQEAAEEEALPRLALLLASSFLSCSSSCSSGSLLIRLYVSTM